jgi:hypothetical protein
VAALSHAVDHEMWLRARCGQNKGSAWGSHLVPAARAALGECLAAARIVAHKRLLASVCADMLLESPLGVERHVALRAIVWPLVRVRPQVHLQVRRAREAHRAIGERAPEPLADGI